MTNLDKKSEFCRVLKKYYVRILLGIGLGSAIFLLIFFLRGSTLIAAIDGTFYAFAALAIIGSFSFITNRGFFDIFAYSFLKLGAHMSINHFQEAKKLNGTYDYTKGKETIRKYNKLQFLTYLIDSLLFLIPCLIMFVIFKSNV